jgi:hypothetical protein
MVCCTLDLHESLDRIECILDAARERLARTDAEAGMTGCPQDRQSG